MGYLSAYSIAGLPIPSYFLVRFLFVFAAFALLEGALTTVFFGGRGSSTPRYSRYLLTSRSFTGYAPAAPSLPLPKGGWCNLRGGDLNPSGCQGFVALLQPRGDCNISRYLRQYHQKRLPTTSAPDGHVGASVRFCTMKGGLMALEPTSPLKMVDQDGHRYPKKTRPCATVVTGG